jgi:riboflavin synthase
VFTGIVEEIGYIKQSDQHKLTILAEKVLTDIELGQSIAVNGACLTIIDHTSSHFVVELSEETVIRTNLGLLCPNQGVNLERALKASTRMGGHFVQGHVDTTAKIEKLDGPPASCLLRITIPERIKPYIVEKGFVAIDGISLTITDLEATTFGVAVLPYTMERTVLKHRRPGDLVNIEVDILAKYLEGLLAQKD